MSVVADARASQCSKLILSAEDFSWAFPHHMERLAEIASLGDLRVIVTLSQMGRRGVSLWQQSVHAGYEKSLAESEALIVGRMVEPDFLAALFSAFGEGRIRVIVVDRDGSRDQMFRHFTNATAVPILPLSESELLHANKSMSVQEAELARLCNECCKRLGVGLLERQSLQVTLRSIFNDERWVEAAAPRPLRMPARWQLSLRTRMQDTIAWVANMHRSGKIHVYGDVDPAALRQLVHDANDRAKAGREIVLFPEGTRRPPGAVPDYKSGAVALYEGLGLQCVPVALNSGLYWPRRELIRYPGTIIVEILDPLPPGLPRKEFKAQLQERIEAAADRLILEAARSPNPPPIALDVLVKVEATARNN